MSTVPLVISNGGLNPSNRDSGFPNLARPKEPDGKWAEDVLREVSAICKGELRAAGIKTFELGFALDGEVPNSIHGSLSMWGFTRNWYYWIAKGPGLPVEVAERLHATHGQQVRVAGNCCCPSPREYFKGFGVGSYHVDSPEGLKALADALRSVYDESAESR